jgi:hypothetical protein
MFTSLTNCGQFSQLQRQMLVVELLASVRVRRDALTRSVLNLSVNPYQYRTTIPLLEHAM